VQALEDSICAMLLLWFVGHKFLVQALVESGAIRPRAN
jgi:hypothetical protein